MSESRRVVIAGGGAAGFLAAITCAEANPAMEVTLYEATSHPLAKVRVSGGGRCNVTHACFEPSELVKRYPRGARELLGPFHRFGPRETIDWFAGRGVSLKTEADGRMFPTSDNSQTIVDCLQVAAMNAKVRLVTRTGIVSAAARTPGDSGSARGFTLTLTSGDTVGADRFLIATGGTKGSAGLALAEGFGHSIQPPVPSLFTFHISDNRLTGLEGLSVPLAGASVAAKRLGETGPILVTHWGLSGPAILKLSAWGARELHEAAYQFTLNVNWTEPLAEPQVEAELDRYRKLHPRRQISTANPFNLPSRLWERLVEAAGIGRFTLWANLSKSDQRSLASQAACSTFEVSGKSMNKEEFVTCGGITLSEVDFGTMQSRIRPGLHFAGEVLDIDGITGGFNFQSAWTTGWHAGRAMAHSGP